MPDIQIPIIQAIIHPPIGLMSATLDNNGPYTGTATLTSFNAPGGGTFPVNLTYGLQWNLNGPLPQSLEQVVGWSSPDGQYDMTEYGLRLIQIVIQHQATNGAWVTDQFVDAHYFPGQVFWNEALPGRIGLYVTPPLAMDVFFYNAG